MEADIQALVSVAHNLFASSWLFPSFNPGSKQASTCADRRVIHRREGIDKVELVVENLPQLHFFLIGVS